MRLNIGFDIVLAMMIIEKLPHAVHAGDWHDKPLKWQVKGPGAELQRFSTLKDAKLWRKSRRMAGTFNGGMKLFLESI